MRHGSLQGAVRRALQPPLGVAAFAAAHFALMLCGPLSVSVERAPIGPVRSVLALYANAAGLDGTYRFFSPDVGDETIATVDTASGSRQRRHVVVGGVADEYDLRFVNFMSFMVAMDQRHLLARALAVRTLAREGGATRATVVIGSYHVPSMREYRAGRRPFMQREYSTEFEKRAKEKG